MTDIRSLEQTLLDNLPWNKARIKFVARFLLALYAVQTVNLSILANAFSGSAQIESNYKRLQRFLRQFEDMFEQASANDHGDLLSSTFASSDLGRLYVVLCGAAGRDAKLTREDRRVA